MTIDRFFSWFDRRNFIAVRTVVLGVTVWMTWDVTVWAFALSHEWLDSGKGSGLELAAVIAAVTAPFTALQVWVFKLYMDAKDKTGA